MLTKKVEQLRRLQFHECPANLEAILQLNHDIALLNLQKDTRGAIASTAIP